LALGYRVIVNSAHCEKGREWVKWIFRLARFIENKDNCLGKGLNMSVLKIGFIGLGQMGRPMALNLLKKRFPLTACAHVHQEAALEIERLGGKIVSSPAEVAQASDVIIIMVRDTPQTEEVIFGQHPEEKRGVWAGIRSGAVVLICSTVDPAFCQRLANAGKARGVDVLDAPVSGGYPAAAAGTLTFMVGGEKKACSRCEPVFQALGCQIYYLGGAGAGQVMKLVNNYMMIINAFGTSEALRFGVKAGLELRQMLEIVQASSGNSTIVQNWDMLAANQRKFMASPTPSVSIFNKDVSLAVNYARALGVPVDLGNLILKMDESGLFLTDLPEGKG
jgi:3-hydroxyisobutyrate dehydrogenase-like beta-hydroxyacid dehydrogenase